MPQLGPHISISDEQLLARVLGLDAAEVEDWPEAVRDLSAGLAAELFLVRYNPFVDPELVRESVQRSLNVARPSMAGDYPGILTAAVDRFWTAYDGDMAFKALLKSRLAAFLPGENIGSEPHTLVECATDATDLRLELPLLVLFPETEEQVRQIVLLANELAFGIIPRGGGTGLTGGAIPAVRRTVILSLSRFKKIFDVDPGTMTLRAQAGVITLTAIKAAEEQGLLFTVDPASKAASTLGGNISENSGGPYAFEYGTTIDNILSYRMVTPRGEVLEVLRKDHPRHKIFPEQSAVFEIRDGSGRPLHTLILKGSDLRSGTLGKDVTDKYLGGLPGVQKEGVDGVITEARFILHKKPAHSRTLCLEFFGRSMHNAMLVIKDVVALRDAIRAEGDLVKLSALEEFNSKYVQAIEYKKKSSRYEGDPISVLLIQLDSDHEAALEEAVSRILDIARPFEGVDIFAAGTDREAEIFWEDRHKLSAIARRTSGFKINEDVVIPLSVIPEFSDFLENLNLVWLARGLRRAVRAVEGLRDVSEDAPELASAKEQIRDILAGKLTAAGISEQEYEAEIGIFFSRLRDLYPRHERELKAVFRDMQARRILIANHMHAGDGNCHVNVPVNSNDPEMLAQAGEAVDEVFRKVLSLKGEISGEHGIGITKIAYLSEEKIEALRQYKEVVDPGRILNPGKLTSKKLPSAPYTFSFNRLILDLQKTALKDKEQLIELLKNVQTCTRCGKCKQVCPMYLPSRGLLFHPRNKNISLGALIEAIYYSQVQRGQPDPALLGELRDLMEHCTACGRCTAACPIRIDSAKAALQMRAFLEYKGQGGHPLKNRILLTLAQDPSGRLPRAAKALSVGQTLMNRAVGVLPAGLRRRMESPLFQGQGPHVDLRNLYEELGGISVFRLKKAAPDQTVFYFPGCGGALFSRSIGLATIFLLLESGLNVALPAGHLCCGYPLLAAGCEEAYGANRHRTLLRIQEGLARAGMAGLAPGAVVTACGTCREALDGYDFAQEMGRTPAIRDALQEVMEHLPPGRLAAPEEGPLYHAACHVEWGGLNKAKAAEAYRAALSRMIGADVRLSPGCCGESGLGALSSPDIYNRIRERKKEQLALDLEGGSKRRPVVVGCPSCKVGVKRGLLQMKRHNPVLHAVEYLAELAAGPKWQKDFKKRLDAAERSEGVAVLS